MKQISHSHHSCQGSIFIILSTALRRARIFHVRRLNSTLILKSFFSEAATSLCKYK